MFGTLRHSIFIKYFWGFMALYLLNCSVDSPDGHPNYVVPDASFNDQESIIEVVVEQLLGYEDAIPENEDTDSEQHSNLKKSKYIDLYIFNALNSHTTNVSVEIKKAHLFQNHKAFLNPFLEIQIG